MGDLLIRNLDETVKSALTMRAKRNDRSLSAEIRQILTKAAQEEPPVSALDFFDALLAPEHRLTEEELAAFGDADHAARPLDLP